MDLVPEGLEPVDDPRDVLPPFRLHLDDDPRWTAAYVSPAGSAPRSIYGDAKRRSDRVREVEAVLAFDDHVRGLLFGLRVVVPWLVLDDEHLPIAEPSQRRLNLPPQLIEELLLGVILDVTVGFRLELMRRLESVGTAEVFHRDRMLAVPTEADLVQCPRVEVEVHTLIRCAVTSENHGVLRKEGRRAPVGNGGIRTRD